MHGPRQLRFFSCQGKRRRNEAQKTQGKATKKNQGSETEKGHGSLGETTGGTKKRGEMRHWPSSAAISPCRRRLEQGNEIQCRGNADENDAYLGGNIRFIVSVSVRVVVVFVMSTHAAFLLGGFLFLQQREAVADPLHNDTARNL